jgi:hypothetical protein
VVEIGGNPSPEEIAAVLAALSARASGEAEGPEVRRSAWSEPVMRETVTPGPNAWRRSALPR